MIRVFVVEDSPTARELLSHIIASDPGMKVVGTANDGEEAVEAVQRIKPDVITMDLHMPRMNGLDAARRIMETTPTPIVAVSGTWEPAEAAMTFRALEAGALAVVRKPAGTSHPDYGESSAELIRTVKAMSEVRVVRRWARHSAAANSYSVPAAPEADLKPSVTEIRLVAIGASTGGPLALQTILAGLPANFVAPIAVVQHIAPGFVLGFAEWLGRSLKLSVAIASHGERMVPGRVYLAPDGMQMQVSTPGRIMLTTDEPENGLRPSVSWLFRSVANTFGQHAIGVLLTGMGKDGAEELTLMRQKGSITIAQDEESSVVFGMPGEAIRLGGATYVLAPARMAAALLTLANQRETP